MLVEACAFYWVCLCRHHTTFSLSPSALLYKRTRSASPALFGLLTCCGDNLCAALVFPSSPAPPIGNRYTRLEILRQIEHAVRGDWKSLLVTQIRAAFLCGHLLANLRRAISEKKQGLRYWFPLVPRIAVEIKTRMTRSTDQKSAGGISKFWLIILISEARDNIVMS